MNQVKQTETSSSAWKSLYRISAVAAVVAALLFRRNMAEEFLLFRGMGILRTGPTALPATVIDWFTLLQKDRFIGLILLNLFDIVNYAMVGLIFLGLYAALRRVNRSYTILAGALGIIGCAVYFASNQAFAMLFLSDRYASAATDAERAMLLAAGEALLAIQNTAATYGNGSYISYFLVTLAGLIFALVMLQSSVFGKAAAWIGILAHAFGLCYYITQAFAPALNIIPIPASAPFLLIWYLLIAIKLLQLGSGASKEKTL